MAITLTESEETVKRTEIKVPYKDGLITFAYPLKSRDNHFNVMAKIDSKGLLRPTTAQTFFLLDFAIQNSNEPCCTEILKRFRDNYLWTSTESLSFPEGVIVYDNTDGKMPSNSRDLLSRLNAGDSSVRFVPKGFRKGRRSISEFLKHPYTIAQVGEEMLEVVERVARYCHQKEAYVFYLNSAKKDTKKFTALISFWYVYALELDGYYFSNLNGGCAAGVSGK